MELLIIAALIGLIPGYIAKNKGRSFGLWWLYGALIFIIALPHALLMKARDGSDEDLKRKALERQAAGTLPISPRPIDFVADGVFQGVPFQNEPDGGIVADMNGRTIKFRNRADFEAMISARGAA